MIYLIKDTLTGAKAMCGTNKIRACLQDMMPQADSNVIDRIDFIADFYEGKHRYVSLTTEAEDAIGVYILAAYNN